MKKDITIDLVAVVVCRSCSHYAMIIISEHYYNIVFGIFPMLTQQIRWRTPNRSESGFFFFADFIEYHCPKGTNKNDKRTSCFLTFLLLAIRSDFTLIIIMWLTAFGCKRVRTFSMLSSFPCESFLSSNQLHDGTMAYSLIWIKI